MAGLVSCALKAVDNKQISQETADKLRAEAADFDPEEVIKAELSDAYLKRRQTAIQVIKTLETLDNANSHPEGLRAGVTALLVKDKFSKVGYNNVDSQSKALLGIYDAMMTDLLYRHKRTFAGLRKGESMDSIIRSMYGENVNDAAAKGLADDLAKVVERTRTDFNRAGGAIPKKDRYIPQNHSPRRMTKVDKGKPEDAKTRWIEYINDKIEPLTNKGRELSKAEQIEELSEIYDTITTDGMSKKVKGKNQGTGKLANKNQAQRILNFKDADSWLEYHKEYGNNDIYSTMTGYIDNMAKDTAALEVLGTNPTLTMNYLTDAIKQKQGDNKGVQFVKDIYAVQTGMNNFEQQSNIAEAMSETRALASAAMLGGAMLSSFGDTVLLGMTARYNGMPATKALIRAFKLMNPTSNEDQMAGVRMGLVANAVKSNALASERFLSGTGKMGTGIGSKALEGVIRGSWLQKWTESIRLGFSMEFTAHIAEQIQLPAGSMNKNLRRTLDRYNISDSDLDMLRQIEPVDQKGVKFLTSDAILDSGLEGAEQLQRKYMGMILQEAEYASITPDAQTRAVFGAEQRGTLKGEFIISTGMFKSFPITMLNTHIYRALAESSKLGKGAYLAQLAIGAGTIASLGLQAKELAAGREPRPIDPAFFLHSMMLGGGLGIFGDFLFADHNRFGQSSGVTAGGVLLGFAEDIAGLAQTGALAPFKEDVTINDFAAQSVHLLKRMNFIDTWQTRLVMERMFFEQLEKAVDPDAAKRFRTQEKRQKSDFGNDYYWGKGDFLPEG